MPSARSSRRKRQTRLTFSPLPNSSPARAAQPESVRDRAAAVVIDASPSPAKKRKTSHNPLPTPGASSSLAPSAPANEPMSSSRKTRSFMSSGTPASRRLSSVASSPLGQSSIRDELRERFSSDSESDEPVAPARSSRRAKTSSEEDDVVAVTPRRLKRGKPPPVQEDDDDDDDDVILTSQRQNRRRTTASVSGETDMDGDESEDLPVPSRRRGRLVTPRRSSIEEADLQEDLEFLAPSDGEGAVVDEDTPRPGRPRSAVKTAKQKALDMLKRKRQKSNTGLSSDAAVAISDDDDEDDAYATEDEEPTAEDWNDPGEPEEDWIVDEEDAEPVEMPVEFRLRTMKPKELFKIAVEWYVQKKINPGFDRDNNAYHIAFLRLSDFVTGMGGSKYRSSVWTPMFLRALLARPILEESHFAGDAMMRDRCDACNRSGHPATYEVRFQGKPYDKHSLEEFSDDEDDTGQETELPSAGQVYYIGKFCMRNARVAHQLHHWQFHLGEWISDYLDEQGHLTPEKILRRDGQSTRKRHRAANKIVEKMDESGEIKTLYRDFKHEIDAAQTGEGAGSSHLGFDSD